ncbi:hypothetical protein [Streptomyces sp. NPDC004675]|uniref:hypothetical protein n=1 Tax=Streptomyces sp. NPDC004675 TaxID=3154286 RepID=UPI0033B34310
MSQPEINLPGVDTVAKTGVAYARDLAERTISTFVVAAGGVAAAGSLLKGMVARAFGSKNSASLAKGV